MVCLGILVNTKDFTLRVPESRLRELSDELHLWLSRVRFTVKELQSLLGELSFVTACVHASRIFLSRLLNPLRSFPSNAKSQLVTLEMRHDLAWWQTFRILFTLGSVDRDIGRHSGRHSRRYSGRQSVDSRSTVGRESVDSRSTVGR